MSSSKKVLILHGWNASPRDHWFWQAKIDWEKLGWEVIVPDLPGNYYPKREMWVKAIEAAQPNDNWTLIGHSLGGVAILHYLEKATRKVKQVILVATPYDEMKFGAIANFFEGEFDWKKIKNNCGEFTLLYQDEDMAVPLEHGKKYAQELGVKINILPGFNHFRSLDLDFLKGLIK